MKISVLILLFVTTSASADVIRPQCQTEETRGLRFVSEAMYKAAKESDPWRGCSSGCQMASSVVDSMTLNQRRFEADGLASLLKARALEAAHCPGISQAIINNTPASETELAPIREEFLMLADKEWKRFHVMEKWRDEHPQCKHVMWWAGSDSNGKLSGSKEDSSGHFEGDGIKGDGWCSADAKGEAWRGSEDDWSRADPDKNDLIFKVICANAMRKFGFGDGSYVDPKFCEALQ